MDMNKVNSTIKRYTSAQSMKDLDVFLDDLPLNVGYNALIAAGIACLMGAGSVWFAAQETEKVSKLHADLMNVQALQPPVPILKYTPVSKDVIKDMSDKIKKTYKGLNIEGGSDGSVTITAQDTDFFPQFLAAISYLQRGGKSWKVMINSLCVGRDCNGSKLSANLQVQMVRFGEPEIKKEDDKKTDKKTDKK